MNPKIRPLRSRHNRRTLVEQGWEAPLHFDHWDGFGGFCTASLEPRKFQMPHAYINGFPAEDDGTIVRAYYGATFGTNDAKLLWEAKPSKEGRVLCYESQAHWESTSTHRNRWTLEIHRHNITHQPPWRFSHQLAPRADTGLRRQHWHNQTHMTSTSRTARCGSACRVVWQGRSLTAAPYADLGHYQVKRGNKWHRPHYHK